MKILIINSEYPPIGGGAGNASANIARELVQQGQDMVVLTSAFRDLPHEEDREGVRVLRIPAFRSRADRSGALEQGWFVLSGAYHALRFCMHWKPDVVLAFFGAPSGVIALILKWFLKIPYVVSLRGGDVPGFRPYDFATFHKLAAPLLRVVWKSAGAIVANSQGLQELAIKFEERFPVRVISNGVDVSRYAPPDKRDWSPPSLLFVGRLVYQKGLDLLIPALDEIKDLPWSLTVAGDGPLRAALEAQVEALGLAARVNFAGWQEKEDLARMYRQTSLFVFPSRHEGMPNAVLEAMSSGMPVIATRIAGNEELVSPRETGLLVPPDDVAALKEALVELLTDEKKRRRMGEQARSRVEAHFTWRITALGYLEILSSMRAE
ncbi:MAG: glycosyltransferase family 4 protein [Anaerolineales bacterium]|nr:glycosyltransferase family 4 protein [Anaerolineales bacterium]